MTTTWIRRTGLALALCALTAANEAHAAGTVGESLPPGFPVIEDASLGKPVIGFGAAGVVVRTPVVFIHGNNDTPFPTPCNRYGRMQAMAQYLADSGYATSELWGLGYQGDQCDLAANPTRRSSIAHTNAANVPDLRRFVLAVLAFTGAKEVDIVAHSLGVTLTREWLRQDDAGHLVRRFVAIDGPNGGIVNCSPNAANYWQAPAFGGFTPTSEVCAELGSPNTRFLKLLNGARGHDRDRDRDHERARERDRDRDLDRARDRDEPRTLVIRNADRSFVYFAVQDGFIAPVPAEDSFGQATDFSNSAVIKGARQLDLVGQGIYDPIIGTGHLGILNSPQTRQAVFEFLASKPPRH